MRIKDVSSEDLVRMATGMGEFDFVLGGGFVPGSVTLLGGPPGAGKSTILNQVSGLLKQKGYETLYASGEESAAQVRMRVDRLGGGSGEVMILAETEVEKILTHTAEMGPDVLVVDSIQRVYSRSVDSAPGKPSQLSASASLLQGFAKETGIAVVLVGHVTKKGTIAGPRKIEHMVDTVIYFEGDSGATYRIMRAHKNRFGSIDEIGVFRMTESGLVPVDNPSEIFLEDRSPTAGSSITSVMEGSRSILLEVQGLVATASYGSPQRVATGFSRKRLALLLAVLEKRVGVPVNAFDVFLNVVGGIRLDETASDAAVVASLASSAYDKPLPREAVFIGEVGLGGEMRRVGRMTRRLAEASKLGFSRAYVPASSVPEKDVEGIEVIGVSDVRSMLSKALGTLDRIHVETKDGAREDGGNRRRKKKGRRRELVAGD